MRILLAPTEISGISARLKVGLRQLGHSPTFIAIAGHGFNYGEIDAIPPSLIRLFQDETNREAYWLDFQTSKGPLWERALELLFHKYWLLRNIVRFMQFANQFDAFVFQYCNSLHLRCKLVKFNDLFWLRLLGKKVVFIVTGSEGRPAYMDGALMSVFEDKSTKFITEFTKWTSDNNREVDRYASCVINNVFTSYFFKRPCVPLQIVGNAVAVDVEPQPYPESDGTRPVVILHSPSKPAAKGTVQITEMIEDLKQEGFNIDFRTLVNRSNREVIEEISRCDFVVDQMWSDLSLAVFAAEAACLARPAVVGGYLSKEELEAAYAYYGVPPSEFCHPSEFKDAIRKLIVDVEYRRRLGEDAYKYVTKYWSPRAVAERYMRIIEGNIPKEWNWDPMELDRAIPVCIPAERSGELASGIIDEFGESALCLDDKPKLKASVLKLVRDWRASQKISAESAGTISGAPRAASNSTTGSAADCATSSGARLAEGAAK